MNKYKGTVQENGQIALPAEWLEKNNISSGNFVLIEETEDGKLVVMSRKMAAEEAMKSMSEALQATGITLEEWLEEGEQTRQEIYEEKYAHKVAGDA